MSGVNQNEMLVGLDVGTSKVVAVVAEVDNESNLEITGLGTQPSRGLRNGVVVDIESTTLAIKKSIQEAESMAGCHISSCYVGISGSHIKGLNSNGVVAIKDGEVRYSDVDRVIETAQAMAIPADQKLLHVLPRDYIIDSQPGIKEPFGMAGARLEAKVHLVTCSENASQNIHTCVSSCGLNIEGFVLEQLASSYSVLTKDERELGVCLIDIGCGTTDIAVFTEGSISFTDVIPIAGDHVTNDIANALRTPPTQAEEIKQRYGCAVSSLTQPDEMMMVSGMGGRPEREMSRQTLSDVLERRYVEIFSIAQQLLTSSGFDQIIPAGIVLTGGASKVEGAVELAEEVFHSPVRIGSPNTLGGFTEIIHNPVYATAVGLLMYGHKQLQEDHMNYIHRDKNILNRLTRWFGGNL
ncbi:MAG: cell division protein FtsA [Gammaproteobacteria bacterium]|nr:cell division protein FtsA [Gammaproteobacteria bacterium]|tara:strand:+ start:12130 stop:13359 length:1230 start_codon:yes stop_codon:yes gene_type:complete